MERKEIYKNEIQITLFLIAKTDNKNERSNKISLCREFVLLFGP